MKRQYVNKRNRNWLTCENLNHACYSKIIWFLIFAGQYRNDLVWFWFRFFFYHKIKIKTLVLQRAQVLICIPFFKTQLFQKLRMLFHKSYGSIMCFGNTRARQNRTIHTSSNFFLIVVARAISNSSKNHSFLICRI